MAPVFFSVRPNKQNCDFCFYILFFIDILWFSPNFFSSGTDISRLKEDSKFVSKFIVYETCMISYATFLIQPFLPTFSPSKLNTVD